MFSALAPRYRLFNRVSSLGLDGVWRRSLIKAAAGSRRVLDLGTGTGDVAWAMCSGRSPVPTVVGIDVSVGMLSCAGRGGPSRPLWVRGDGAALPFRSGSFDAVVSAYVLRNLWVGGVLPQTLRECARVLAPTGRLVFLDLTQASSSIVRWGQSLYNTTVLPFVGRLICGRHWPGGYLARSIASLPSSGRLKDVFQENGFKRFEHRPLWGGIVSLFIGHI